MVPALVDVRLGERDCRAVSIEVGIQNSALGLVLVFNFFGGLGGMAILVAWWGIWHILSGLGIANIWARIPYGERFRLAYFTPKFLKKG